MKRYAPLVGLAAALFAACGANARPPIRYVALNAPGAISSTDGVSEPVTVSKTRFGILYRPPQDVGNLLSEIEKESGKDVLTNVEVQLQTPFCLEVVCLGVDRAFAGLED